MSTVRDIMTRDPVLIQPEESVGSALTRILASKVNALPVADAKGFPIGILSLRDIVGNGSGSTAGHRMRHPVTTVQEKTEVSVAAQVLANSGHPQLVVVDKRGKAVGLVTAYDLIQALVHNGGV